MLHDGYISVLFRPEISTKFELLKVQFQVKLGKGSAAMRIDGAKGCVNIGKQRRG